jgi:hypothetical protein
MSDSGTKTVRQLWDTSAHICWDIRSPHPRVLLLWITVSNESRGCVVEDLVDWIQADEAASTS